MKKFNKLLILATSVIFMLTSCVGANLNDPENKALFSSFPADTQQKIKNHEIEKGFTQDMIRLSLGKPDSKTKFEFSDSPHLDEVWLYRYHWTVYVNSFSKEFRSKLCPPNSQLAIMLANETVMIGGALVAVGFKDGKVVDIAKKINYY